MNEVIERLEAIKHLKGQLFISSTLVTDHKNRLTAKPLGYCPDGFEYTFTGEDGDSVGYQSERLIKREIEAIGMSIKFKLGESMPSRQFLWAHGYGDTSDEEEDTEYELSDQEFTLFGYNATQLPYHNITINSISTTDATPTTYTGSGITDNFNLDLTRGRISAKRTGAEDPDTLGTDYTFDGEWNKPEIILLTVGNDEGGEKTPYSLWFLAPTEDNYLEELFIPKVYMKGDPRTITNKKGEKRVIEVEYDAAQNPEFVSNTFYQIGKEVD